MRKPKTDILKKQIATKTQMLKRNWIILVEKKERGTNHEDIFFSTSAQVQLYECTGGGGMSTPRPQHTRSCVTLGVRFEHQKKKKKK